MKSRLYKCDECNTRLEERGLPEGLIGAGKVEYFCPKCDIGFSPEAAEAFCSPEARCNQSEVTNFNGGKR
ncbi:MAG: hypothetical protein ACOC1X_01925 [Promethearchaeota archaeon]